jgi:septal ring factor EnvC (AmiA/AmiB activator)
VQIHRYLSDFPVNVKTTGTNGIKDRLAQLTADVADLAAKVKETKDADQKKAIKQQIAEHKVDLKKLNDDVKRADKMDVSKVKNIDEFIYQEAQSRMRELFVVYHSMKEAAMDCFLLKNFHADDTIQCLV